MPFYGFHFSAIFTEILHQYEQLRSCDLLVIDDLGAERTTDFVIEQLVLILEDRNYQNKPWIINSNLDLNQIKEYYTARTSDRILERARVFKLVREKSARVEMASQRKRKGALH